MNSLLETLNRLGGHFLSFAWPMLWQSSVLIAVVWAVDLALARKIRAVVRHALWLVVLVKLLLPPTLALPTGAAWWLFPAQPPAPAPAIKKFTITFDHPVPAPAFVPQMVPVAEPPPQLDRAGWTLLATGAVSAGLLLWLLFRWAQVVRLVNRATPATEFSRPIAEARRLAGLRGPVRVRTVASPLSPAVCGLFRPVILLPLTLAETFSAEQLRAVLLHEVLHLLRRDIWVNCAQSLLQIIYWWHPLVWVANARLRRVREEAVDDAVMLALDAEREIYAPTLLEVARLALRRPLLSLGLVGIMESPSALRQRIERLVTFRAPRQAGLTLASLGGILLFSAVALPMGEAPAPAPGETAAEASPPLRGMTPPATTQLANPPAVLVTAEIYQLPAADLQTFVSDLTFNLSLGNADAWWSASPVAFSNLLSHLKNAGLTPLLRPHIQTSSGKEADFFVGNDTHGTELDCLPVVTGGQVDLTIHGKLVDASAAGGVTNRFQVNASMPNHGGMVLRVQDDPSNAVVCLKVEILPNPAATQFQQRLVPPAQPRSAAGALEAPVFTGPGRQAIAAKLGQIRFDNVSYDGLPLSEVLKQLSHQCKLRDPAGKGVNFLINPHTVLSGLNPNSGLPTTPPAGAGVASSEAVDVGSFIVKLPGLSDVRLADVLDAIVLVADHPLKYSVQDFAIVFSARDPATSPVAMRAFRADPNTFYSGLEQVSAESFGAGQNGGSGSGQSQNNGAVVGVVNAFPGAGSLRNTGQGANGGGGSGGAGGQGSGSSLNPPPAVGVGGGGSAQGPSGSEAARQAMVTFRLSYPKTESELKTQLLAAGVKMPPTTFIYNARAGLFAVRGAPDQLALVNRLVLNLNGYSTPDLQSNDLSFEQSLSTTPPASEASTNLFMRTFRVDPHTFYAGLENVSTPSSGAVPTDRAVRTSASGRAYLTAQTSLSSPSELARTLFANLGVNLSNPPGKSVFFNDRLGYLFVKATESDLDTIERAIQVLNQAPPQLHLKARFYQVPKGTLQDLGKYLNPSCSVAGQPSWVLTSQNATAARQALQARQGVETLAEPEMTLLSGRQAQMRATEVVTVITNLQFVPSDNGSSAILPETNSVELGPILDLVPYVLADGYTINLAAIPSVTEFLGYDVTNELSRVPLNVVELPKVVPKFRSRQLVADANLWDGQTLVVGGLQERVVDQTKESPAIWQDKELLVFITATIVDPAGNRVHSDEELPFARDGIPTQPPLSPERNGTRPGQ